MSNKAFLESPDSGPMFTGGLSEQNSFSKKLRDFKAGKLTGTSKKRVRISKYHEIEERLLRYIELRSRSYQVDKCGLSLEQRLLQWASEMDQQIYKDFQASSGFISRVLKDNKIIGVKQANDMSCGKRHVMSFASPWSSRR